MELKNPFPDRHNLKRGRNNPRYHPDSTVYYCDTLHTSICFPYNGGHRRGLQTHLMLSARFLERIFQSDHYLFAPPTGSLKINTNRTLFSSTNFGEHIYLNLALYYSPLTLYVKRMIQICTITFIYSFYSCALFYLFVIFVVILIIP